MSNLDKDRISREKLAHIGMVDKVLDVFYARVDEELDRLKKNTLDSNIDSKTMGLIEIVFKAGATSAAKILVPCMIEGFKLGDRNVDKTN